MISIDVLKWIATLLLIVGAALNGLDMYPWGPLVCLAAELCWIAVSIAWREASLIVVNLAMLITIVASLAVKHVYTV